MKDQHVKQTHKLLLNFFIIQNAKVNKCHAKDARLASLHILTLSPDPPPCHSTLPLDFYALYFFLVHAFHLFKPFRHVSHSVSQKFTFQKDSVSRITVPTPDLASSLPGRQSSVL